MTTRTEFILAALAEMPLNTLNDVSGLDMRDIVTNNVLDDLRYVVRDAYEGGRVPQVHPNDSAYEIAEGLRRDTALTDFVIIGAAHRMTVGDDVFTVEPGTEIRAIVAEAVQRAYDNAAHSLISHLENAAQEAGAEDD